MPRKNITSARTKTAIQQAFAELLQEKKTLRKITVSDLTERAEVTRGTFYNHYNNVYAVAEQFQQEALAAFFEDLGDDTSSDDIDAYIDTVFNYLSEHEKIYRMLLASDASITYLMHLNEQFRDHLAALLRTAPRFAAWRQSSDPKRRQLEVIFFVDGAMYLVLRYFRNDTDFALADIKTYVRNQFWQTFGK